MSDIQVVSQQAWRNREDPHLGRVPYGTIFVDGEPVTDSETGHSTLESLHGVPAVDWRGLDNAGVKRGPGRPKKDAK